VTPHEPVDLEGQSETERRLGRAGVAEVVERGTRVVVLGLENVEALVMPTPCLFGDVQRPVGMAAAERFGLRVPVESFRRVFPNRREDEEATSSVCRSRLLSASDVSVSRLAWQTSSAAARSKAPAKTASRRKSCFSSSVRRS